MPRASLIFSHVGVLFHEGHIFAWFNCVIIAGLKMDWQAKVHRKQAIAHLKLIVDAQWLK